MRALNTRTIHTHPIDRPTNPPPKTPTDTDGRANVPLSKSIDIEPIGADEALAQLDEDGKPKKKDKEQEKKEREAIKVRAVRPSVR